MKNGFLVQGGAARQSLLNYISLLFGDYMIQNPIAKSELLDLIYPIGSVYINVQNVSPEDFLGGVWEQIQGRFLLAMQNGRYTAGDTGGEETHTLTVDELPSHYHNAPLPNQNNNQFKLTHYGAYFTNVNCYDGNGDVYVANDGSAAFENMPDYVYTGGNQPHNNMPPYLVVYMWQRTE